MELPRAVGPADLQGRQQVGVILLRRQGDRTGAIRGPCALEGIEIADDHIGIDAEGACMVESAIGGDDEGAIRNVRGLPIVFPGGEDDAGARIICGHIRQCSQSLHRIRRWEGYHGNARALREGLRSATQLTHIRFGSLLSSVFEGIMQLCVESPDSSTICQSMSNARPCSG